MICMTNLEEKGWHNCNLIYARTLKKWPISPVLLLLRVYLFIYCNRSLQTLNSFQELVALAHEAHSSFDHIHHHSNRAVRDGPEHEEHWRWDGGGWVTAQDKKKHVKWGLTGDEMGAKEDTCSRPRASPWSHVGRGIRRLRGRELGRKKDLCHTTLSWREKKFEKK
jgi:hypothetical protein